MIGASLQEEVYFEMLWSSDERERRSDCRNKIAREGRLSGAKIMISLA